MEMRGDQFDVWSAGVEITFKAKQPNKVTTMSKSFHTANLSTNYNLHKQAVNHNR